MRQAIIVVVCLIAAAGAVLAQPQEVPTFWIQYKAGDRIWKCSNASGCKGSLIIEPDVLRVVKRQFKPGRLLKLKPADTVFTIPLAEITKVENATRREDSNRLLSQGFGFQVTQDNRDYVTITVENQKTSGAFVFLTGEHQATNLVAKIEFALKNIKQ